MDKLPASAKIVPFLKWAGGKRWFTMHYMNMIPAHYARYIEPFLGSGAMFFAIQPKGAILSDLNPDLIDCFRSVSKDPGSIEKQLAKHHKEHCKTHYYKMRSSVPSDSIERAVRLIYLNRTCWNGLYRVNKKNQFNVPIGTKKNVILPSDDFLAIGRLLSRSKILCQDFEGTIDDAGFDDFVFVDPPYTVNHNDNGFLKYNDKIFSWGDQVRLRDSVRAAAQRGAKVLVTNANHISIREIYKGIGRFDVVARSSVLAASSAHRFSTQELVVRTWLDVNE